MNQKENHDDLNGLLREQEAAQLLGFTPRTLQAWRVTGRGPTYIRISSRAVRYRRSDLIAWTEEHRRTSTSSGTLRKKGEA